MVTFMEIYVFSCQPMHQVRFDYKIIYDSGVQMASYLRNVANGTVLLAVTSQNPSVQMFPLAYPILKSDFGVDVSDVPDTGSFAFIAQKGYSGKSLLVKGTFWDNSARVNAILVSGLYDNLNYADWHLIQPVLNLRICVEP